MNNVFSQACPVAVQAVKYRAVAPLVPKACQLNISEYINIDLRLNLGKRKSEYSFSPLHFAVFQSQHTHLNLPLLRQKANIPVELISFHEL